jgi:hypothetical protein
MKYWDISSLLAKVFIIKNKSVKWMMSKASATDYPSRITHYRTDTMSEIVNQSLQKIAKGIGIIFIGTIICFALGFLV